MLMSAVKVEAEEPTPRAEKTKRSRETNLKTLWEDKTVKQNKKSYKPSLLLGKERGRGREIERERE